VSIKLPKKSIKNKPPDAKFSDPRTTAPNKLPLPVYIFGCVSDVHLSLRWALVKEFYANVIDMLKG
jgi:hypothetical protein